MLLLPFPFPQSCPALVTPKSQEVVAALVVKGWGAGGLVLGGRCTGCCSPGSPAEHEAVPEERGLSPICVSSTFRLPLAPPVMRLRGAMPPVWGGSGGADVSAPGNPGVFLGLEELLLLPTPVRTFRSPSPTLRLNSSTSQRKQGMTARRGRRDFFLC